MDALSEILSGIRLSGSAFFDAELTAPWSVQTPTGAEIAKRLAPGAVRIIPYHLIVQGACSLRLDDGPPLAVEAREVICFPHGDVHQLASSADLKPTIPTEKIVAMTRADEVVPVTHGGGGSTTRFVCGFFACASALSDRIVTPLPRVLKFRVGADSSATLLPSAVRDLALTRCCASCPSCFSWRRCARTSIRSTTRRAVGLWRSRIGTSAQL